MAGPYLKLEEDEHFYFDPVAAELPILFIEKYLRHYEDRYADQPFLLLDWQKRIARDVWGWKRRVDHQRRFREIWLELSKGQGKSPFICALAVFEFFCARQLDGTPRKGLQAYSIATDFQQANITFDAAKKMILQSPQLERRVIINNDRITLPKLNNVWRIISGTADGKAGFRPNVILADEIWEWSGRRLYDNVEANLFKRTEPLFLMATNSGTDQTSICYELHQRALDALAGKTKNKAIYPVIYAAAADDDIYDEAVWAKANPSLGHTILIEDMRAKADKAREARSEEEKFRRLNLSQWRGESSAWLDMSKWDACVRDSADPESEDLTKLPCCVGLDLSLSDDLSSIAAVWMGKRAWYVRSWTYVPRATAIKYEARDGVPYAHWAAEKHIRLLKSRTVDDVAHRRIAKFIASLGARYYLKTIGYDKWRATRTIARLEKDGLTCVPVRPDYEGMSGGCHELERRLTDGSIVLPHNPALRWQAANCEAKTDKSGNIRIVKEHAAATANDQGRRASKIDAIAALVIALSECRRHVLGKADDAQSVLAEFTGEIRLL